MTKFKYLEYHKIILGVFIIGIINLYSIVKHGIIINLPTTLSSKIYEDIGILTLDSNSVKIIGLLIITVYLIFQSPFQSLNFNLTPSIYEGVINSNKDKRKWGESVEYELLIGLGLIGLILILLSKDIVSLYLGIEFYSFTTYILILVSPSINTKIRKEELNIISTISIRSKLLGRVSIIYLILSSLASGIFLYGLIQIYSKYGIIDFSILKSIPLSDYPSFYILLLLIALLFKLGTVPFNNWLIRLYTDLDIRILWYQLTLPKLVYYILLIKVLTIFQFDFDQHPTIIYILLITSFLSIIVGSIGGLFQKKDNLILSYSSILNIGNLILALALILLNHYSLSDFSDFSIGIEKEVTINSWILYNYIFVYIINLMGLFSTLFLFYKSSNVLNIRTLLSYPSLFFSLLIIIFSFIGIPPFSGFFSKFYLIFSLYSNHFISYFSILLLILSSILSAFFYLKFLFSSISSTTSIPTSTYLNNKFNSLPSFILSYSTLFTLIYPLLVPYLIPCLPY